MKKLFVLILVSLNFVFVEAQVARWAVHPKYDRVNFFSNNTFLVSNNKKYGIMGDNDKEILPITYDSISDFRDGVALVINKSDNTLIGYTDTEGHFKDVADKKFRVDNKYPFFKEGFLLVYNSVNDNKIFYYINKESNDIYGPYTSAFPINEGYAPIAIPFNTQRPSLQKSFISYFSTNNRNPVTDFLPSVNPSDIRFVSSRNNGKSIILIKKYFYEYDFKTGSLSQLSIDGTNNKKSFVTSLTKDIVFQSKDEMLILQANNATFTFDNMCRLISLNLGGNIINYNVQKDEIVQDKVLIDRYVTDKSIKVGLTYLDNEILPQQFDDVVNIKGNKAVVKQNGKYGAIVVDKDYNFGFKINDGKDVCFEHEIYSTRFVASLPPFIKASTAKIESITPDCFFKVETRQDNENIEATAISYDCDLKIPFDISETVSPYTYKYEVVYDGLRSKEYPVVVNEWFVKSYEVEINDYNSKDGVVTINFETQKSLNNDNGYIMKTVELEPDLREHLAKTEKISENTYVARIYGVNTSSVTFNIDVTESGCPTVSYPFTLQLKNTIENPSSTIDKTTDTKKKTKVVSKGRIVNTKKKSTIKPLRNNNEPLFIPN